MKAMSKASQRQWGKQQGKKVEQLTAIKRYPEKKTKEEKMDAEKKIFSPSHFGSKFSP